MGIIESTKQLYSDIQSCIDNLIKARLNKESEYECYQQMEHLLVCSLQQFQCVIDELETNKTITANILQVAFPSDTVWHFNRSEIVGYSISKNLHFVIEDGLCYSENGHWLLSVYSPSNLEHYKEWLPSKERDYSMKYIDDDKIMEEWINFGSWEDIIKLKTKLEVL